MINRQLFFLFVITIILTLVLASCSGQKEAPSKNKTQNQDYTQMNFNQLDSIVKEEIFISTVDVNDLINTSQIEGVHPDWMKILQEHQLRIQSDPDTRISFSALNNKSLHPGYRSHLITLYSESTEAMSLATLKKLVSAMEQIFSDRDEDEFVRQAAMRASDNLIIAARGKGVVDEHYIDEFTGMNMKVVLDETETSNNRRNALHALRSRGQKSEAPALLKLINSGNITDNKLKRDTIKLLGEWKYQEIMPVAVSLLNNSNDPDLREGSAYALGFMESAEIIRPLLECVENRDDLNSRCAAALNKQASIVYEMIQSGNDEKMILALRASRHVRGTPEKWVTSLTQLLDNKNPEIVLLAAKRLVRNGDPELMTMVLDRVKGAPAGSDLDVFWNKLNIQVNGDFKKLKSAH